MGGLVAPFPREGLARRPTTASIITAIPEGRLWIHAGVSCEEILACDGEIAIPVRSASGQIVARTTTPSSSSPRRSSGTRVATWVRGERRSGPDAAPSR